MKVDANFVASIFAWKVKARNVLDLFIIWLFSGFLSFNRSTWFWSPIQTDIRNSLRKVLLFAKN